MAKTSDSDALFKRPENTDETGSSFSPPQADRRLFKPDPNDENSKIEESKTPHDNASSSAKDDDAPAFRTSEPVLRKARMAKTDAGEDEAHEEQDRMWSESAQRYAAAEKVEADEEETQEKSKKKKKKKKDTGEEKNSLVRLLSIVLVIVLFLLVGITALSAFVDTSSGPFRMLEQPKKIIMRIMEPIQETFSDLTESVADLLRDEKISSNIEYEYNKLLTQVDELASEAAMAEEYKRQINDLYDLMDEINRNTDLNPVPANVIGHDTGNYFSVLTINVGSRNGVSDYMAVVFNGGLVGYTYDTQVSTAKVRCIIDGEATVFGLLQTSRDQGAVKGSLSIDGEARCRMYYLPENSLPRPGDVVVTSGVGMEFPKGIPIGTVRESTRNMENNMSYIVVDPIVDFQHLEYVVVYRYQPSYAEDAQDRSAGIQATLEPLTTARPQATFQSGIGSGFNSPAPTDTPDPAAEDTDRTPGPTDEMIEGQPASPESTERGENLTYHTPENVNATETPAPTMTPIPSPTPTPKFDPNELTIEDD